MQEHFKQSDLSFVFRLQVIWNILYPWLIFLRFSLNFVTSFFYNLTSCGICLLSYKLICYWCWSIESLLVSPVNYNISSDNILYSSYYSVDWSFKLGLSCQAEMIVNRKQSKFKRINCFHCVWLHFDIFLNDFIAHQLKINIQYLSITIPFCYECLDSSCFYDITNIIPSALT